MSFNHHFRISSVIRQKYLTVLVCVLIIGTNNAPAQDIFRAACRGNVAVVDSLLQTTSLNIKDERERSLMHWAIGCRKDEMFDFLLRKGIDINEEDQQGMTPMHVAIKFGNEFYFNALVNAQPNKDWIDTYDTSLLEQAVLVKNLVFLEKLLTLGAAINSVNQRGSTALEIAQRMELNEITEFLLSKGADPSMVRSISVEGKYMGYRDTGNTPVILAPNFISTEEQEFGSVFNAAGTEFYFAVDVNGRNEIRFSRLTENRWTKPEVILSHESYSYNDPFLSPDESRLYFISNQPTDGVGDRKDIDIWYMERNDSGWSELINAGPVINTSGNEYYISFTADWTMYFSTNGLAPGGSEKTDHDIYYSKFTDGVFQTPVALGESVNTKNYEADVFVAPDESYLIFVSTREDGFGRGDLYISFKKANGKWSNALNMGDKINTHHYEYCPFVTRDGKYLLYTSNQDIYMMSTRIIDELKKTIR